MTRVSRQKGFTLVELSLAMAFVSVLLLAIVMTAIQAGRIYNKGVVLESVNQAARDIGDSMRRDFMQSDATRISDNGDGGSVILLHDRGQVVSGRVCLGGYSYLWNAPSILEKALAGDPVSGPVVRQDSRVINFVRVVDEGGSLCANNSGSYETDIGTDRQLVSLLDEKGGQGAVLAIHELRVVPIVHSDNNPEGLFRINYTVGTSVLAELNGQQCRPPSDAESNDEFCAINQFEMIVRTNG